MSVIDRAADVLRNMEVINLELDTDVELEAAQALAAAGLLIADPWCVCGWDGDHGMSYAHAERHAAFMDSKTPGKWLA